MKRPDLIAKKIQRAKQIVSRGRIADARVAFWARVWASPMRSLSRGKGHRTPGFK